MKHTSWLSLPIATFGCLIPLSTQAQVTPDGTTSTTVNGDGNNFTIEQGDRVGDNLFHSFDEFSVPTMGSAVFNNAGDIANIFSRVTGSSISNIDGILGAMGTANLFLINPNGIIFGQNARLDLGGSFFASTADSLLFEGDTEFSAVNPEAPPLLEVSIPIGARFRDNSGDIVNRSFALNDAGNELVGLEVLPGNSLTLLGGDINFDAGEATASGGNIRLGGLAEAGIVKFNEDSSLSLPQNVTLANVTLTNNAIVDVTGTGGGNVTVDAENLTLAAGDFGRSLIIAGIEAESINPEAQAGNVTVNVVENISLNDSLIINQVTFEGVGNSGNITINTGSLELINGGIVDATTFGLGDAGAVNVTATGDITADGEDSLGFQSGITSLVNSGAEGNSGGVTISTNNLNLNNGGRIDASTGGSGDAGAISVTATGDIIADGENSDGFQSGISSLVNPNTEGNSGGVTISTNNLNLTNGGRVIADTFGTGDAGAINVTATGDITADGENSGGFQSGITSQVSPSAEGNSGGVTISTNNLNLNNGGRIDASTGGSGDAGAINVTATGNITADGENSLGSQSGIASIVNADAQGNSGGLTISTNNLNLTNGGRVSASTLGIGNARAVDVTATGNITADGENSLGFPSGIASGVNTGAEGNSGGVTISTNNLNLTNGGRVSASTSGTGNAGAVDVTATGDITADGEDSGGFPSGITSLVNSGAEGNSGGVTISTNNLNLTNGGQVNASTDGIGNAGAVNVAATGNITADGENSGSFPSSIVSGVDTGAEGNAEGVTIFTTNLNLSAGGRVAADTLGTGNAGAVNVTATGDITADGENSGGFSSNISSGVNFDAQGNSGGVTISTANLNLTNGGRVGADTFGIGDAGAVNVTATGDIIASGEDIGGSASSISSLVNSAAEGNSGGVTISAANLNLTNGAFIGANTFGIGNAGDIDITIKNIGTFTGEDSQGIPSGIESTVGEEAQGNSGSITISTNNLNLTNGGQVNANTGGAGDAGAVNVTAMGNITVDGENSAGFPSGITSLVDTGAEGDAGGVTISTNNLNLTNGGRVDASTFGTGNASDVNITASESISIDGVIERFRSSISATALNENGNGGDISINTGNLIIANGGTIEATNFDNIGVDDISGTGQPGNINITVNSIELTNSARIEAATQFVGEESANINLNITEDLTLENNSFISAEARANATGGNVTINANDGFILAFPNQNNDIIANASEGRGGAIDITTQAIFGLEERPLNSITNDINASSQATGLDGTVDINNPAVDPTTGLINLPASVGDASDQISQNPCQQGVGSQFIVTGKGGLPPNPTETLNSDRITVDLVEPLSREEETRRLENGVTGTGEDTVAETVPAMGWVFNDKGEVTLTAYSNTDPERAQSQQHRTACHNISP